MESATVNVNMLSPLMLSTSSCINLSLTALLALSSLPSMRRRLFCAICTAQSGRELPPDGWKKYQMIISLPWQPLCFDNVLDSKYLITFFVDIYWFNTFPRRSCLSACVSPRSSMMLKLSKHYDVARPWEVLSKALTIDTTKLFYKNKLSLSSNYQSPNIRSDLKKKTKSSNCKIMIPQCLQLYMQGGLY